MTDFPRYAIYFAAGSDSALSRFGAELLGYDAYTGDEIALSRRRRSRVAPDWRDITADPRKYGFHGTLKAPMALAPGRTRPSFWRPARPLPARRGRPVIRPVVDAISGFIAVIPAEPVDALQELAADCVRAFDGFRTALTAEDRARRKPEKLSERQRDYLDRWGYPYVMEEFRFHMTLTGRLDAERRGPILEMLRARFAALGLETLAIDRIALFKQDDARARFRIVGEWALAK